MVNVDWNFMHDAGLVWKINKEILHPLGLAISYNPATGVSSKILISDDGTWEFSEKSNQENQKKYEDFIKLGIHHV